MKNIKVLGTGCTKCNMLSKAVAEVVQEHNIDAQIEKVEDLPQIMAYNVMATPALVVDEKVVAKGRIPSKAEILEMIG